ncbi:MAG: hypothetical protein KDJ34_02305 [Candidatus Competibacteraceae bacterium]|nr:hypothetical protein [Candidatus Competibacteraceae bacterium]
MSTLSVRVSEDPHRPLGHAIVTIDGLPHTLETFVFALNRHGFTANHLGADGWQGAECWLQPKEAWYDGDSLKFVIDSDLAFQLENMPYQMAIRGQGLSGTASVTFIWPLELAIEEDTATTTRRVVVSGARVGSRPKTSVQPAPEPDLPDVQHVDLPIPDLPIPEIGNNLEHENADRPARPAPLTPLEEELPAHAAMHEPEHSASDSSASDSDITRDVAPTRRVNGRIASTPLRSEERVFGTPHEGMPKTPEPELPPKEPSPHTVLPSQPPPESEPPAPRPTPQPAPKPPSTADSERHHKAGLFLGLGGAAVLAAAGVAGWWWLEQRSSTDAPAFVSQPEERSIETQRDSVEPIPAPEPVPLPSPDASKPLDPVSPKPRIPPASTRPPSTSPPRDRLAPPSEPAAKPQPGSKQSLEEELKSQFDPAMQELEKRLRPKSP